MKAGQSILQDSGAGLDNRGWGGSVEGQRTGGGLQSADLWEGETGGEGRQRGGFGKGCWVTGMIYMTKQCRWRLAEFYKHKTCCNSSVYFNLLHLNPF